MALKIKLVDYRRLVIAPLMTFRSLDTDTLLDNLAGQTESANRNTTTTTKRRTRLIENFAFSAQNRLSAQQITQEYFSYEQFEY